MSALPVATNRELAAYARRALRSHRGELGLVVGLQALAAVAGLFAPWLLGTLVADVTRGHDTVLRLVLLILGCLAAQSVLVRLAEYAAARLGEKILADLREDFVSDLLALPPETVEDADAGDLITRTTRDIDLLSGALRSAVPATMTSVGVVCFTLGALALVSPVLLLPVLLVGPVFHFAARWYLRRAHEGYLRQAATYSRLTEGLAETVEGARTVDALRLTARRMERVDRDVATSYAAERHTLRLRNVFLPICDTGYALPVAAMLIFGGTLYLHGVVSLAAVTAGTLYASQLLNPLDQLMFWLDSLQAAGAALARLLGPARLRAAPIPVPSATAPAPGGAARAIEGRAIEGYDKQGRAIEVRDLRYAYRPGHDVLCGIDLTIRQGERLAVVGPSGAGKSTLAKLLAGVYTPHGGGITVGGREIAGLSPVERRGTVALVTQDHHVFRGSLRDNLTIARPDAGDEEIAAALRAVDAWEWAEALGVDSPVGFGGPSLDPAKVQQLALARLLLADPEVPVLDEATSLLNPRAARHLERSLAAVTRGRTVIAVVHRLHTARDADRIAVLDAGRLIESGTHEELLAGNGAYAGLWNAWQG
ncbi:ABC transporter ATP-binding protein [Kitasatospora sp. NPDC089797]|uniref:ABC transporter ATP-binding protein n=1 Tax=Kitasatospora sp. NPDC089797 TaxID=3155298 RepID=UPI00342B5A5D